MKVSRDFINHQKITIPTNDETGEVWGELFEIEEFPDELFFICYLKDEDRWSASELSTGMSIYKTEADRSNCIKAATEKMARHKNEWLELIKPNAIATLANKNIPYPLNEIEK